MSRRTTRDGVPAITVRLAPDEEIWIRRHAAALDMDIAEMMRKSLSLAVPLLMANAFVRRVSLEDVRIDPDCR